NARAAPRSAIGANCASNQDDSSAGVEVCAIARATNVVICVAAPIIQLARRSRIPLPTAFAASPANPVTTPALPLATLHAPPVTSLTIGPTTGRWTLLDAAMRAAGSGALTDATRPA